MKIWWRKKLMPPLRKHNVGIEGVRIPEIQKVILKSTSRRTAGIKQEKLGEMNQGLEYFAESESGTQSEVHYQQLSRDSIKRYRIYEILRDFILLIDEINKQIMVNKITVSWLHKCDIQIVI